MLYVEYAIGTTALDLALKGLVIGEGEGRWPESAVGFECRLFLRISNMPPTNAMCLSSLSIWRITVICSGDGAWADKDLAR